MLKEYESYDLVNINDKNFKSKFVERLPNEKELDKDIKIHDLIEEFSLKVFGFKEREFLPKEIIGIDYIEDLGYYMLTINNNNYSVIRFSKDPVIAFKEIVINILIRIGREYEKLNRNILIKDYQERFNDLEYNSNLYILEYGIDKWVKYYDYKVTKDIIGYYENKLDNFNLDLGNYKYKKKSKVLVK